MKISIKNKEVFMFLKGKPARIIFIGLVVFAVFAPPVLADSLNETKQFFIDHSYDYANRETTTATLRYVGKNIYFYAENDWWNSLTPTQQLSVSNSLVSLSMEFDNVIYPQVRAAYGSEWKPGIDNDDRITVLATRMVNDAGGYFRFSDEKSRSKYPISNEREMLYLNAFYINDKGNKSFLAHEFQHLITYNQKNRRYGLEEEVWLNEARSEYTATLLGYDDTYSGSNLERRVNAFRAEPSDPLAEWRNEQADYGAVNLFMQYLVGHYGEEILSLMTQNNKVGIASVEAALRAAGITETFDSIFAKWVVASYLNDCSVFPTNIYCYNNSKLPYEVLHADATSNYILKQGSLELATWIKDWTPRWYKVDRGSSEDKYLRISFEGYGSESNFEVFYVLKENGLNKVHSINLNDEQKGGVVVPNFGSQVSSVVLMPLNLSKRSGFGSNDPNTPFSLKVSVSATAASVYPDGSLIKASDDSKVYLVDGGAKRWIPSAEIFTARGFKWEDIKIISSDELTVYFEGAMAGWPDGTLVKSADYPEVYVVSSGQKRVFPSAELFLGLGYQWKNIKLLSREEIDRYQFGGPVQNMSHPDGALIKFANSPNIYLIEQGQKRLIPSVEAFLNNGFSFDLVLTVDQSFYNKYSGGIPVQ